MSLFYEHEGIRLVAYLHDSKLKRYRCNIRGFHFQFHEAEAGLSTMWESFEIGEDHCHHHQGIYEPSNTLDQCIHNTIAAVEHRTNHRRDIHT